MKNLQKWFAVIVVALSILTGCEGCRERHGKQTGVMLVHGPLQSFPSWTHYADFAIGGDFGAVPKLYVATTELNGIPALYRSDKGLDTTQADWQSVGQSLFGQQKPERVLIRTSPAGGDSIVASFSIRHPSGLGFISSIHQSNDGGVTWRLVAGNIDGDVTGIELTNGPDQVLRYGGVRYPVPMQHGIPFVFAWDDTTKKFVTETLPDFGSHSIYEKGLRRDAQIFFGSMDEEVWAVEYRSGWRKALPTSSLPTERIFDVTVSYGPTSQASWGPRALGEYGIRTATGYTPYPVAIAHARSAYGEKYTSWVDTTSNEIWRSGEDGKWEQVYIGNSPTFNGGLGTYGIHFSRSYERDNGGMWIVSSLGTHFLFVPN